MDIIVSLSKNTYIHVTVGAILVFVVIRMKRATIYRYQQQMWNMMQQWRVVRLFLLLMNAAKRIIMWILQLKAASPSPCFDNILLRCLRSCAHRRNHQIQLPRSADVFAQLRSLAFFDSLRKTGLESYMYMVCNPDNKEENLSKALLHFLYNRLRIEAMSKSLTNPDGSFDLLAECPDLAKMPGLNEFPGLFKTIKDIAVKDIFESVANVDHLSDVQCDLVIELIKIVMIKKAYEDLEDFEISVGKSQLYKLIGQMALNKFVPSTKDMPKLISKSLCIPIHVLTPGKEVVGKGIYNRHTIKKTCTAPTSASLEPLILYEQKSDSYALVSPPKQLYNQ